MKRLILLLTTFAVVFVSKGATYTVTVDDIYYTIDTGSGEAVCTGASTSLKKNNVVILDNVSYDGTVYPVTSIREKAFWNCSGLTGSLTIGDNVQSIGDYAFSNCSYLTGSLTLGENVSIIGKGAFYFCDGLTGSLTIPNSVKTISDEAFKFCWDLTGSLTIGENVQEIGEDAFGGCSGFTGSLIIPNSVQTIGDDAFALCESFTGSLTIGTSVQTIGSGAFADCGFTGMLTIGKNVKTMGGMAFIRCNFSGELIIPESVTEIGTGCFLDCNSFSNLNIKSRDVEIYSRAFECSGLQTITCEAITPPPCIYESSDNYVFDNVQYNRPIYVPAQSLSFYKNATEWKKFNYIYPIPVEATNISLNKTDLILLVGQEERLIATLTPDNATTEIVWNDDNNTVISVDQNGIVKAIAVGTANITATCGEVSANCTVTVKGQSDVTVKPGTPGMEGTDLTLRINQTEKITLDVPADLSVTPVFQWELGEDGEKYVRLSQADDTFSADFTGLAFGKTGYTVKIQGSNEVLVSGNITVIAEIPMTSLMLEPTAISMAQNALSQTLTPRYTPEGATMPRFGWTSSAPTVATVDDNGVVTPVAMGAATITCAALDGSGLTATCEVTVTAPVDEDFEFEFDESVMGGKDGISLYIGDTYKFVPKAKEGYVLPDVINWTSTDDETVSVNNEGLITALALGEATITASASVNGKEVSAICKVTVIPVPANKLTLSAEDITLLVGQTDKLTATVSPENTTDKTVTWKSDNEAIATVSADGTVTAISVGTANITATCGDVSAICKVTVNPVLASTVTINLPDKDVFVGDKITLTASVTPENTTDKTLVWASETPAIATIDATSGELTAIAPGEAKIKVTCGDVSATATITVKPILAQSVTLSTEDITLLVGATQKLIATVEPQNVTDKTITWKSDNESIATVSADGTVTAISVGTANITATCGDVSAICKVTVTPVSPTSIELNIKDMILFIGQSETIQAIVRPANTTYPTVTWQSENESIATVSADGKVTGISEGTTTITASCGEVNATCTVTVNPIPASNIEITSGDVTLTIGSSTDLIAKVSPENTTHPEVEWLSSDTNIATITADGTVTGINIGSAIITAKCGNVSATCTVTVIPVPSDGIIISPTSVSMLLGDEVTLSATVFPENTTDKTVTWGSDNPSVATVSSNGVVTALSIGNATITASNGNSKATCAVTVNPVVATSISLNVKDETIFVASSTQLVASISPSNVTDKTITWTSSKPEIATVSDEGLVTGVSVGTTTVTATIGSVSASCQINVVHRIPDMDPSVTTSNRDIKTISGKPVNMAVYPEGGEPTGWSYTWTKNGKIVSQTTELNITAINESETVIAEIYRVKVENEIDKVVILSEIFDFVVQIYPAVDKSQDDIGIIISTDNDTSNKTREGNVVNLSVKTPNGGNPQGWGYVWSDDQGEIGEGETVQAIASMSSGNTMAIEETNFYLELTNYGPEGDVWAQFNLDSNLEVYRRPLTPLQLLRKGDGTSRTFVTMMPLLDSQLEQLDYNFVYGWTDSDGKDHIIEITNLRYCHTETDVYNNSSNKFWVYSIWNYQDGSVVSSGKCYLDGIIDESFDASVFGGSLLYNEPGTTSRQAVYSVDGQYIGESLNNILPGIYIRITQVNGVKNAQKIIIR